MFESLYTPEFRELYQNDALVRIARRISKKAEGREDNDLTIQVAIESDNAAAKLSHELKLSIPTMIQCHAAGLIPFPTTGTQYRESQWQIVTRRSVNNNPELERLQTKAEGLHDYTHPISSAKSEGIGCLCH